MNYYQFTNPDGSTQIWVNLEAVHAANPSKEGRVTLHTPTFTIDVDEKQFKEAIKGSAERKADYSSVLSRLTQALDRLSVRIPSSIRLHM